MRKFMLAAHTLGMTKGDWTFLDVEIFKVSVLFSSWYLLKRLNCFGVPSFFLSNATIPGSNTGRVKFIFLILHLFFATRALIGATTIGKRAISTIPSQEKRTKLC